jgi:hypothetical protein
VDFGKERYIMRNGLEKGDAGKELTMLAAITARSA